VLHAGEFSTFRKRSFGAPHDDRPVEQFVVFAQNHDQVGNRALGDRLPAEARPLAAFCTLLSPFVPMLFMGEEYGEECPFPFFCSFEDPQLIANVREGRRREFAAFAEFRGRAVPDPQDPEAFAASKLTRAGAPEGLRDLYAALLSVRRELPPGDADQIEFDEHAGWLRVRRGPYVLVANFSRNDVHVPVDGTVEPVVATARVTLEPGFVVLSALSGALVRLG